jgi:beta-glucosidase
MARRDGPRGVGPRAANPSPQGPHLFLRRAITGFAVFLFLALGPAGVPAQNSNRVSAAAVPTPQGGEWLNRHRAFCARARAGGIDLLFIGDSITAGWNPPVWDRYFGGLNAANFGIAADRTEHVLWRVMNGELEGIHPRLVVLMIGTNNLKSGPVRMEPDDVAEGVAAILRETFARLPDTQVLLLGILPRQPKYEWFPAAKDKTNVLLARLADGRRVHFMDFGSKFLTPAGTVNADLLPDLLHPNAAGYEVWAQSITGTVRAVTLRPARAKGTGAVKE